MKHQAVGIDLGTSNSCVAMLRGDEPEVIANNFAERTTASVVAFEEDGTMNIQKLRRLNDFLKIYQDQVPSELESQTQVGEEDFSMTEGIQ